MRKQEKKRAKESFSGVYELICLILNIYEPLSKCYNRKEEFYMTLKEISLTPQNDFLFKSIFAKKENKEMLKEFLEGILKAKIDKLSTAQQEVTILLREIKNVE